MTARWDEIKSAFIIHRYGRKVKIGNNVNDGKKKKEWKLTSAHVNEDEISKMKVKLAAQVLSDTVAEFLIESSTTNRSMFYL